MRVITYNTGCGNPKVTTPEDAFLGIRFYEEAMTDSPDAPILCLQEVGRGQLRALRAERDQTQRFALLVRGRLGQANAMIVPSRYKVLEARSGYYGWHQARAYAQAKRPRNHRQYLEARMWIMARLEDEGRVVTVFCTHLSGEKALRLVQAEDLAVRVIAATRQGPVIVAGDLNARAGSPAIKAFAPLKPMTPARDGAIDWILVHGLSFVDSQVLGEIYSDHFPREATLRFPD